MGAMTKYKSKLLPCPFCGGEPTVSRLPNPKDFVNMWGEVSKSTPSVSIECRGNRIGVHGLVGCNGYDENMDVAFEKACTAWNTRADIHAEQLREVKYAVQEAAKTFRWYEEMHRAKPDHEKADRNRDFAIKMEGALAILEKWW